MADTEQPDSVTEPDAKPDSAAEPDATPAPNTSDNAMPAGRPPWFVLERILMPVIVTLLAVGGSFFGTYLANKNSTENLTTQLQTERAAEERGKRADIYLRYIQVAQKYQVQATRAQTCSATKIGGAAGVGEGAQDGVIADGCQRDEVDTTRLELETAYQQINVYGTSAGRRYALELYKLFPPRFEAPLDFTADYSKRIPYDKFKENILKMEILACLELQNEIENCVLDG